MEREKRREKFKLERQSGGLPKEQLRALQLGRLRDAAEKKSVRVGIDLQFDDAMNEKELNHLANQLKRVYGANKAATRPFHLHFLGLRPEGRILRKCCEKNAGFLDYVITFDGRGVADAFANNTDDDDNGVGKPANVVVYLSPDATEELESLDPARVYIIGGLVDDSVQSRVSLDYARQQGLSTACLPINRYMRRRRQPAAENVNDGGGGVAGNTATFKQILTINQVFEILLTLYETGDWRRALKRGVPARTGFFVVDEDES